MPDARGVTSCCDPPFADDDWNINGDDSGALCEGPAGVPLTEPACEERAAARGVLPAPLVFELLALDRGVPFTELRFERLDAGDDMLCIADGRKVSEDVRRKSFMKYAREKGRVMSRFALGLNWQCD